MRNASIDIDAEDGVLLCHLKSSVGKAEHVHDDGPTIKTIKKLVNVLVDVDDYSNDKGDVLTEGMHNQVSDGEVEITEKENPTQSHVGSVKSLLSRKKKRSTERDDWRES